MKGLRLAAVTLSIALCSLSGHALAQSGDKAQARELFFEAGEALNSGDYVRAADLYRRANDLYPAPTSLLGLARSLVQLGRLVEASDVYAELAEVRLADDAVEAFQAAVKDGAREGEALDKRIPRLSITVDGPQPDVVEVDEEAVTLTGAKTTLRLDPGKREVTASHPGYEPFNKTVALAESTVSDVTIALVPLPSEPAETTKAETGLDAMQISGIVVGSVGLAGLVVWGVTGGLYMADESTVDEDCPGNVCQTQEGLDAANRAKTLGLVNTVSLFAGIGLAAVGTTLFLLGGDDDGEPSVALRLGSGLSLEGRF
jgi:hypothetical protein